MRDQRRRTSSSKSTTPIIDVALRRDHPPRDRTALSVADR
jgi:hypothetical protein